jgi:hypothetical protein
MTKQSCKLEYYHWEPSYQNGFFYFSNQKSSMQLHIKLDHFFCETERVLECNKGHGQSCIILSHGLYLLHAVRKDRYIHLT